MGDFSEIELKLKKLRKFLEKDIYIILGEEAVNHFQESFDNEGFTDKTLKKWDDVKRRDSNSSWYGFKYGSKAKKPANHPSRNGTKRKYKKRKDSPTTNYSPAATKHKILRGSTGDLKQSIAYKISGRKVHVFSDKKYAKVQNEGGKIKVFGNASATLPKRQFMGRSDALKRKIKKEWKRELNKKLR